MAYFPGSDPAQVLKDLLHIGLSAQSESADLSTSSIVQSAAESFRLSDHGSGLLNNCLTESDAPDKRPMNLEKSKQHIMLLGSDRTNVYPIYGNEVEIVASLSSGLNQETHISDKVSVDSIDKCDWKQLYYFGNLVAVHQNKTFVAYATKDKTNSVVKVLNRETEHSVVLEGFTGSVVDISFANSQEHIIIAAVDQTGDLRVFKILLVPSGQLLSKILLHLQQFDVDLLDSGTSDLCCRVVWCPSIPEKKEDGADDTDDIVKTEMFLAFSCNCLVRVLSVDVLYSLHKGKPVDIDDLKTGCCLIDAHSQPVFDMALVPDGSTLATASADGFVRFHELDLADYEPPKCLFEWEPHNGQPVSLIIFLDDLKNTLPGAQWWKFAITGVDQNREFKLWSCETWSCLQTLTFSPSPYVSQQFQVMPCIKARLDSSASYLVLSDIMRKTLYVLHVEKGDATRISSVAEFLLVQPCLGLAIEDVVDKRKPLMANHSPEPLNGKSEFSEHNQILSLFTIQTKALEYLKINLMPSTTDSQTFSSEFLTSPKTVHDAELVSSVVSSKINQEDGRRNSLEIVPSESGSFTRVTSVDESDQLIDLGSHPRNLSNSSAAAETASRDLNQSMGNRPSTELSCALAHISSIQLPVQASLDAKSKVLGGQLASVVTSSGDFPYPVLSSSSGARPKDHLTSGSVEDASKAQKEQSRLIGLSNEEGDSSRTFVISSYSDVSVASEHHSEGHDESPPDWLRSEPLFHDRTEVSLNKNSKENLNSSLDLEKIQTEDKEVKVESPRVLQQASDLLRKSSNLSQSSPHAADKSSPGFVYEEDRATEVQVLEILKMLREQQKAVVKLHESVVSQSNVMTQISDLQTKVTNLEKLLVFGFKDTVGQFRNDKDDLVQQVTNNLEAFRQQQLQQQLNTLSQVVRSYLHSELASSIEYEMQRAVLPGISNILDPVAKKLTEELSQKLTSTDAVLKDSVKQMVRSKTMTEVIGKVVSNNLEAVLHTTCRDQLIPAFDRGCQNVLSQVNETFQKGLNTYMQQMQKQAEKIRIQSSETTFNPVVHQLQGLVAGLGQVKESRESLNRQLTDVVESVGRRAEELDAQKTDQSTALTEAVNGISAKLIVSVREMIQKEMSSAFKEHQAAINEKIVSTLQSRSSTPAPQVLASIQPLRTQIVGLVQHNQLNAAFQLALSAMDLGVVTYLCEMVNPDELFAKSPFPLDQPVLLSLIQQLSSDLRIQTQLKYRYLEEALLNVDQKSPMMKEHLPAILEQLCANAENIQQASGLDQSLKRSIKRLIMAAKFLHHSLISQSAASLT